MTYTTYTMTHKTRLQLEAMQAAQENWETLTESQQLRFTMRLAGLLASYWPASQDMECLKAIAEEARRCGA